MTINFSSLKNDTKMYDKPTQSAFVAVASKPDGTLHEVITVRFMGKGETVYCNVWIHAGDVQGRGKGNAGGGGYCKRRAAADEAFRDMGIDCNIDGCGVAAVSELMKSVCRDLGYISVKVVEM